MAFRVTRPVAAPAVAWSITRSCDDDMEDELAPVPSANQGGERAPSSCSAPRAGDVDVAYGAGRRRRARADSDVGSDCGAGNDAAGFTTPPSSPGGGGAGGVAASPPAPCGGWRSKSLAAAPSADGDARAAGSPTLSSKPVLSSSPTLIAALLAGVGGASAAGSSVSGGGGGRGARQPFASASASPTDRATAGAGRGDGDDHDAAGAAAGSGVAATVTIRGSPLLGSGVTVTSTRAPASVLDAEAEAAADAAADAAAALIDLRTATRAVCITLFDAPPRERLAPSRGGRRRARARSLSRSRSRCGGYVGLGATTLGAAAAAASGDDAVSDGASTSASDGDGDGDMWSSDDDGDGLGSARRFVAEELRGVDLAEVNKHDKSWRALWEQVAAKLIPRWLRRVRAEASDAPSPAQDAAVAAFERLPWVRTRMAAVMAEVAHEYRCGACAAWELELAGGELPWDAEGEVGNGVALAEVLQALVQAECVVPVASHVGADDAEGPARTASIAALGAALTSLCRVPQLLHSEAVVERLCTTAYRLVAAPAFMGVAPAAALISKLAAAARRGAPCASRDGDGAGRVGGVGGGIAHGRVEMVGGVALRRCLQSAGGGGRGGHAAGAAVDARCQVAWLRIVQAVLLCCPAPAGRNLPIPRGLPRPRSTHASDTRRQGVGVGGHGAARTTAAAAGVGDSPLGDARLERVFKWVAECVQSPHPMVARAALELTGNAFVTATYLTPRRRIADVVAAALVANRDHWHKGVADGSEAQFDAMLDSR
mmetsp:Transcript_19258/g.68015  ORF Transcript_19258/g.68015 Transcript_19258/m.68015 type:complete len:771 (-) Transcript_19258:73-2385(-)